MKNIFLILGCIVVALWATYSIRLSQASIRNAPYEKVPLLRGILKSPLFTIFYPEVNSSFNSLAPEILAPYVAKRQKMATLEAILDRNPKAIDALLQLSLLHEQMGNAQGAAYYRQQAAEIDPRLKQ